MRSFSSEYPSLHLYCAFRSLLSLWLLRGSLCVMNPVSLSLRSHQSFFWACAGTNDACSCTASSEYAIAEGLIPDSFDFHQCKAAAPLALLPIARPITSNPRHRRGGAFTIKKIHNATALLVQLTGEDADPPCQSCSQGHGLWVGCVRSKSPEVERLTQRACANCYYNGLGTKCSFRDSTSKPCGSTVPPCLRSRGSSLTLMWKRRPILPGPHTASKPCINISACPPS